MGTCGSKEKAQDQPVKAVETSSEPEPVVAPAPTPAPAAAASTGDNNFKPVHSAIRWNRSFAEVEAVLQQPWAIDCVDAANGNRPIHIAAQNGHLDIVQLLIAKKCDIDAQNAKGNTGVHMAMGYDYFRVAKALIDAGAREDIINEAGFPAISGLEGGKVMGMVALIDSTTATDAAFAFEMCEAKTSEISKVDFAQAGLKTKKNLGPAWTPELQEKFKSIMNRLE